MCGKIFYSSEMYLAHMDKAKHNVPMCCHYCRKENLQPLKILWHLRQFHHYNLYRCSYCLFGTDIPVSMIDHLKFQHYMEKPIYYYCKSFLEKPEVIILAILSIHACYINVYIDSSSFTLIGTFRYNTLGYG